MNKKIYFIIGGFIFLSITSFIFLSSNKNINILAINSAEANPDFICIKTVTNQPCTITSCGSWIGTQRTCIGKTATQIAYYSIRIGCAEGGIARQIGESGGASGRRSADFIYNTSSCTIVQTDTTPPTGDPETTYE